MFELPSQCEITCASSRGTALPQSHRALIVASADLRPRDTELGEEPTHVAVQETSADEVFAVVYDELRRIARRQRRAMHDAPTLDTTALVHEAYLKLLKSPRIAGLERGHFFAIAARAMRQILVDQARRRNFRRGSGQVTLTTGLSHAVPSHAEQPVDLVALDRALGQLGEIDPRGAQAVEWRVFGGLGVAEIAELQGVTPRTVARDWRRACAYLLHELNIAAPVID